MNKDYKVLLLNFNSSLNSLFRALPKLSILASSLFMAGCVSTSPINNNLEEILKTYSNTLPKVCVNDSKNGTTSILLSPQTYSSTIPVEFSESGNYARFLGGDLTYINVSYNFNNNPSNFNDFLSLNGVNVSDFQVANLNGYNSDDDIGPYYFKVTIDGKELHGIKYLDDSPHFEKFKARFENFKMVAPFLDEFVFLHEMFHGYRADWERRLGSNFGEFIADVSSIISVSLNHDFSYDNFIRFYNEIKSFRSQQNQMENSTSHYNSRLWGDLSIIPSKEDYEKFLEMYKKSIEGINDYAEYDHVKGCLVINASKIPMEDWFSDQKIYESISNAVKKSAAFGSHPLNNSVSKTPN